MGSSNPKLRFLNDASGKHLVDTHAANVENRNQNKLYQLPWFKVAWELTAGGMQPYIYNPGEEEQ